MSRKHVILTYSDMCYEDWEVIDAYQRIGILGYYSGKGVQIGDTLSMTIGPDYRRIYPQEILVVGIDKTYLYKE